LCIPVNDAAVRPDTEKRARIEEAREAGKPWGKQEVCVRKKGTREEGYRWKECRREGLELLQ